VVGILIHRELVLLAEQLIEIYCGFFVGKILENIDKPKYFLIYFILFSFCPTLIPVYKV